MKTKLLLVLLAICGITNAQITITISDVPAIGTIAYDINDTLVTTSPGNAGTNQAWDLTTLKNNGIDTLTFMNPGSTPYTAAFPTAIIATYQSSGGIYSYTHYDAAGAQTLGIGFPFFAGPFLSNYFPPYRFMTFPATYGTSIIDSTVSNTRFAYPIFPTDSMKVISHMHYTETMDGWGTVTTPAGSFPCLRDIAIRNHIDTTFTRNGSTGLWSVYSTQALKRDTFYFWYASNQDFLVAEIQHQEGLAKQGFYLQSHTTKIQETVFTMSANVYPNPFTTATTIRLSKNISNGELTVYDVYGQKVKTLTDISGNKITFPRENLTSGIYFIQVKQGNKLISSEKIIVAD